MGCMLLCAGLATFDIVLWRNGVMHMAGGTATNVAAAAAWLGTPSAVAARVGDDEAGRHVARELRALGVDTALLEVDEGQTMRLVHSVSPDGHRFSVRCPGCRRTLPRHRGLTRALARAAGDGTRAVVVDRVTTAGVELAERIGAAGASVVYEPSRCPRAELHARMLACADLVKVSDDSGIEALLDHRGRRSDGLDVVTLGSGGLRWRVGGGPWRHERVDAAETLDAAGAGDWTTAALLHRCGLRIPRDRRTLEEAFRFAQAIARLSVRFPGARGLSRWLPRNQLEAAVDGRVELPEPEPSEDDRLAAGADACPVCLLPPPRR
jgi:sugar/nucleoside kinase (ribokinase family)